MEAYSDSRLKNDLVFTAKAPVMGTSASGAETPLANVAEQLDSGHALVFWMRSA